MKKRISVLLVLVMLLCLFPKCFNLNEVSAASYSVKINVTSKKYGAKKGTDSTKAIQKALDDASEKGTAKKPGLVKIPKGTYYISKPLEIGSNTVLQLDKNTVIKKSSNSKVLYMLRSKPGKKGGYDDNKNITIKGGCFDAEYIKYNETSGGSLFFFVHTTNLKIQNVTLKNNYGTHLIELGGVKTCTISGCKLSGFKAKSSDVEKEAIQLDVTHDDSIMPAGEPFDDTPCQSIIIKNNEISDYPRAIGSHIAVEGIYHKLITISDNSIHDISAAGIYGYNYVSTTISDNTLERVGNGVVVKSYSKASPGTMYERLKGVKAMDFKNDSFQLKVKNNKITTNTTSDLNEESGGSKGIFVYGSENYPIRNCVFSGNTISSDSCGIYLRYVENSEISDNNVDRPKNAFDVDKSKFSEDAIKLLNGPDCTIKNNKISSVNQVPFENGIAMRDGCDDCVISDNTINKTKKSGIALYDSDAKCSNNTIYDAGKHGMTVQNGKVSISDSKISGSLENGLTVQEGSEVTISDTTISDSSSKGIVVGGNVTLDTVSVYNNAENGITVLKSGVLSAASSEISKNKSNGVSVLDGGKAVISECSICDNGSTGVMIGGNGEVTDSTIMGNKEKGITVLASATANIRRNTLSNVFTDSKEIIIIKGASVNTGVSSSYCIKLDNISTGSSVVSGECATTKDSSYAIHVKIGENEFSNVPSKKAFSVPVYGITSGVTVLVWYEDGAGNIIENWKNF